MASFRIWASDFGFGEEGVPVLELALVIAELLPKGFEERLLRKALSLRAVGGLATSWMLFLGWSLLARFVMLEFGKVEPGVAVFTLQRSCVKKTPAFAASRRAFATHIGANCV